MILAERFTNLDFRNKTVVVTGGSKGIGQAICYQFAQFHANICIFDIDQEEGVKTVNRIRDDYGVACHFYKTDLLSIESIRDSIKKCIKNFNIDILVNNAGVGIVEQATSSNEDMWDLTFAVNTKAAFFVSQEIGKSMIPRGYGKIINLASQAGVIALPGHTAYSASKAALISITKSLAFEWAQYGISVNAISPTIVLTDMGKKNWMGPHGDEMKAKIPNGRFAIPEEVAYLVAFLASDMASMINGENIIIDGGYSIY